jgi:hypothetical protein
LASRTTQQARRFGCGQPDQPVDLAPLERRREFDGERRIALQRTAGCGHVTGS